MATIGELLVQIKADTTQLTSAMAKAEKSTNDFSSKSLWHFAKVTAAILAIGYAASKLAHSFEKTIQDLEGLHDRTERLRISAVELQKLEFIGGQTGIEMDDLNQALLKLQRNIARGAEVFGAMGLSVEKLKLMSTTDQVFTVGRAIEGIANTSDKALAHFLAWGRTGARMAEMMGTDIRALSKEYDLLGFGLTQSQADAADTFSDTQKVVGLLWDSFKINLTAGALVPMQTLVEKVINLVAHFGGMRKITDNLLESIAKGFNITHSAAMKLAFAVDALVKAYERLKDVKDSLSGPNTSLMGFLQEEVSFEKPGEELKRVRDFNARGGADSYIPGIKFDTFSPILSNLNRARGASGAVGGVWGGVGSIDAQQPEGFFARLSAALKDGANKLNTAYDPAVKAVTGFSIKAQEAANKIQLAIETLGESETKRILHTDVEGKPIEDATSQRFDNLAREVLQGTEGWAAWKQQYIYELENISSMYKNAENTTEKMDAVIAKLNKDVDNAIKKEETKVWMTISMENGLVNKIVNSSDNVKFLEKKMAETAQQYGSK